PSGGLVKLRLSSYMEDATVALALMEEEFAKLPTILGDVLVGEGASSMQEIVAQQLLDQKKTVATAESCTGGYIAHLFTSMAGSSEYFYGSVVSYATEVKEQILDVPAKLIAEKGV